MGEKKIPFRYLTQGAESASSTDSGEPLGLPVPTLEERARLFLRAVHGERHFTSSEHTEARGIILKGMAADVAAKSNSWSPGEPPIKPVGPLTDSRHGPVPTVAMSEVRLKAAQPTLSDIEEAHIDSLFEDRPEPLRAAARRERPVQMSRARPEVAFSPPVPRASVAMASRQRVPGTRLGDSSPPFPAETHKPPKRRVFIWAAVLSTFTGLSGLSGLVLYQMATRSVTVTAQSTPGDTPQTAGPDLVQPRYGAGAMRPRVDAQLLLSRVRPAPKYLERARTVIAAGDIEAVRIALSRMIESGNASAAVDLGSTYDPNILDALGIRNFPADVSKARAWYQRAQQMGSPDAAGLLESLERSERPSR
jgi:hypothetical protein